MENDQLITNYTPKNPPRVIKPHRESDFTNPLSSWFKLTAIFGTISCYPAWRILNYQYSPRTELALALLSFTSTYLWWKYCGMFPRRANRSWRRFWFAVDRKVGMHKFNKYTTGITWFDRNILRKNMKTLYPAVAVHYGGVTEFVGNEYVQYIQLNPKKLNDKQRLLHRMNMKGLVDGLHNEQHVKIFTVSRRNPKKHVIEYLMKIANKTADRDRVQHLTDMITNMMNDQRKVTVFRHYAMIGLGQHSTLASAQIASTTMVDNVLVNMEAAGLRPKRIENRRHVQMLLRESISERRLY